MQILKEKVLLLDPRTQMILLIIANIVAFVQHSMAVEVLWVIALCLLITFCGYSTAAAKFMLVFAGILCLQYYIFPYSPKIIATTFTLIVSYIRKFLPCVIIGTMIVKSTSVRCLMLALRQWKIPQGLIIPLSVTMRYFPAIKEEAGHIRAAMKMRGIHGVRKLECLVVPLIISATTTAEELSAAAITRGIENPVKKTSVIAMRFGIMDVFCMIIGALFVFSAVLVR